MKLAATDVLLTAIQAVMAGEGWVGLERVADLDLYLRTKLPQTTDGRLYNLTPRELQIISAVVSGRQNKEIASKFEISEDTVKHHLSNTFNKTGVSTRLELAMFAVKHKLPLDDLD